MGVIQAEAPPGKLKIKNEKNGGAMPSGQLS